MIMKHLFDLLGRILLSFIFFFEAYDSLAYAKMNKDSMTDYGITYSQDFFLYAAIGVLVLGGLMLLTGYRMRTGAILLLIYWVPWTFTVYDFWNVDNDTERRMASIQFMLHVAIMGGLLIAATHTSGKYAIKRLFATTRVG